MIACLILLKTDKEYKRKIGVPEEHLLLYAPTIRDKGDADCFRLIS